MSGRAIAKQDSALATNGHGTAIEQHGGAGISPSVMEQVLQNDLGKLSAAQRVEYYLARCDAAGLDPRTKPFDYITFQGKLTLYPNATALQQMAANRRINVEIVDRSERHDLLFVVARGTTLDGRVTERTGVLPIKGLSGDALALQFMKGETKAARRVVLALTGMAAGPADDLDPEKVRRVRVTESGAVLSALPEGADPAADMESAVRDLKAEWASSFDASDGAGLAEYIKRALGRNPAPKDQLAERAADYRAVASDLRDRPEALKAAIAAYAGRGKDPDAEGGEVMRREMGDVCGQQIISRAMATTRELLTYSDWCRQQDPYATEAPGAGGAATVAEQGALGLDDPCEDEA